MLEMQAISEAHQSKQERFEYVEREQKKSNGRDQVCAVVGKSLKLCEMPYSFLSRSKFKAIVVHIWSIFDPSMRELPNKKDDVLVDPGRPVYRLSVLRRWAVLIELSAVQIFRL